MEALTCLSEPSSCAIGARRTFLVHISICEKQWARQQNVLLVGCDPDADVQVPGGWGLSSSPNDAFHGHFHQLRSAYTRASMHLPLNPLYAYDMKEFESAASGIPLINCPIQCSLRADAWALQQISDMNGGKTILWAWMSRGYLEPELAAAWHFGGEGVCCSVASSVSQSIW